jgi:hypothetical protein
MTTYIILVVLSIILIFIAYQIGKTRGEMSMLQGFWESNPEFNKEAGLDTFTFYIGDKCNNKYPSYLLMIESGNEQTILINEPTTFILEETFMNFSYDYREFKLKFNNLETSLLPSVLTMKFYPHTCKIVLYDHKKIYAVFFKNLVLSEMERIKNEKNNSTINKNKLTNKDTEYNIEDNTEDKTVETVITDDLE